MNITVLFERLGPYHHARLLALSKRCSLKVIELSQVDTTYKWEKCTSTDDYGVSSLFTDKGIFEQRRPVIRKRLRNCLAQTAPDVVMIPGWYGVAQLEALRWCAQHTIPAVVMSESTEDDFERVWWKEGVKRYLLSCFTGALVGGTPHRKYLCDLGMAESRIFDGYDAIDNLYFMETSQRIRNNEQELRLHYKLPGKYFLACSRFIKKKNLLRLIDAYQIYLKKSKARSFHLVLMGDGEMMGELRDRVQQYDIGDVVHFVGFRQYADLPVYYSLASCFILASTSEQWGLVVNEAMASGLPVLVSKRCGCCEDLVEEGVTGFSFDPFNIEQLGSLLQDISMSQNLKKMGSEALRKVSDWGPEKFARQALAACLNAQQVPQKKVGLPGRMGIRFISALQ